MIRPILNIIIILLGLLPACYAVDQVNYYTEDNLKKSYHITTKFRNSLMELCDEPTQEEYQYFHSILNTYFEDKTFIEYCNTSENTKKFFKENREYFDEIINYLIEENHNRYHRKPIEVKNQPIGIIQGFWKNKETGEFFGPFSMGQAVLISNKTFITAKHALEAHTTIKNQQENLEPVYCFYYPTDQEKAQGSFVSNTVPINEQISFGPNGNDFETLALDVCIAQLESPLEIKNHAILSKNDPREKKDVFILYGEHDGEHYHFYKTESLEIKSYEDFQEGISDRLKKRLFITNKFLKPGISGAGIVCSEKDGQLEVLGAYNGKIDINNSPIFHFSPINKHYDMMMQNIQ